MNTPQINFKTTPTDRELISDIARRACKETAHLDRVDLEMDLAACHLNGCPLRLYDLLHAPEGSFGHDVHGIQKFISRDTGKLTGSFLPRFALPEPK